MKNSYNFFILQRIYNMNETTPILRIKVRKSKNTIIQKHVCGTCGKSFMRKKFYDKHIIACESSRISQYKEECKREERESMPSQMELYRMFLDLSEKHEKLNNEVQVLRNYVERTKKKINIIGYLNNNHPDVILFDKWIQNLAFDDDQLNNMFKHGYVDGVYLFLQQNLPITDVNSHPIKCFDQKRGIFYCMTKDGWITMNEKDITIKCLRIVNARLMKKFSMWRKEHKEKIDKDHRFYEKSVDYQRIVFGGNIPQEQSFKKLKIKLYNYLKCDLKNIIQYEFVF